MSSNEQPSNDNLKPYCGIKEKPPKGQKRGSMQECIKKNQVRLYGVNKVDNKMLTNKKLLKKDNLETKPKLELVKLTRKYNTIMKRLKKEYASENDAKKRIDINKEYKRVQNDLKDVLKVLRKLYPKDKQTK